jgi:hypothetical protein
MGTRDACESLGVLVLRLEPRVPSLAGVGGRHPGTSPGTGTGTSVGAGLSTGVDAREARMRRK